MYFVEPNLIQTKTYNLQEFNLNKKILLLSDLHLGIFKSKSFAQKIVQKISQSPNLDAILIAGDLTYEPTKSQNLTDLFSPFAKLDIPILAVLGNHDVCKPGPDIRTDLENALKANNIVLLNNQTYQLSDLTILGLGSHINNEDDTSLTTNLPQTSLILTHNPDTTLKYTSPIKQLTVCGHTHVGQIQIPYLYKIAIPTKGVFPWEGFRQTSKGPLFISGGVGEVILPLRLGIPPTLYVLNL